MDRAWDKVAGKDVDAEDLWQIEKVDRDRYECIDCRIPVWPASYQPENKVRPYFRRSKDHEAWCDVEGELALIKRAKTERLVDERGSFPGKMPNRLDLRNDATRTDPEGDLVEAGHRIHVRREGAGGTTGRSRHTTAASSIRRICRAYLNFPNNRDQPLSIDGLVGVTYAQVVRMLETQRIIRYDTQRLRYAELAWAKPASTEEFLEVPLSAGRRDKTGRVIEAYRVRVRWAGWSKRARTSFETDIEVSRTESIEAKRNERLERSWLFFIGRQDADDQTLFHVEDQRLICSLSAELLFPKLVAP
ncbi:MULTISPECIES: hypothetical protein [unclassified Lysobacter]|uniref:hypothetical protein n=1 Tax=unclassified Lysobacter TaxID=2635362 RepID=UPI001BEBCC68|nr:MULTISPECIES: hypothetical protein [unclassified Lysobacter]MBT2748290.1 hypothetical protein [Lysobacter sp. ISL-42]MBT2749943.1 hypothetical protein [Lysobacter sp. ISL-50]MBT2781271.1 hypothetical protein [Lysobacter sp. ISL-52]